MVDEEEETTSLLGKDRQPQGGDEFGDGQALLDFADGRKRKNVYLDKCKAELEQREKDRREKERHDALLDPDVEEMKARDAIALALKKEVTIPEEYHKLVDVVRFHKSPAQKLAELHVKEEGKYVKQPDFDSAFMSEVRAKVLQAELSAARSKGLKVEQELLESFEGGAHDTHESILWLGRASRTALISNGHLHSYMQEAERTKHLFSEEENGEAEPEVMRAYKAVVDEKTAVSAELQSLVAEIEAQAAQEEQDEASKRALTEMATKDSAEEKLAQAKLAAKIKELRLRTISPNPKEFYVKMPLRLRKRVLGDQKRGDAHLHNTASERWFWCEKVSHWLFFGDVERIVTSDEKYWEKYLKKQSELGKRRDRNRWSPYQYVQNVIVENVGGNVAQTFTYYQFIMDNNFVMSNMWTLFVIIPFLLNPPEWFDMSKITWAGLAGMDDKGLEYSWFYYGAYPSEVDIGGWMYPMGTMYIVVYLLMFFFQLSVMMGGVFESIFDDMSIEKEYDDPYAGIGFTSSVLNCPNHCIMNKDVKYTNKILTIKTLRTMMYKLAAEQAEQNKGAQAAPAVVIPGEEPEDPRLKKAKIIIGRTFGCVAYLGLFQISTNGIQFCYQNEEAINKIMPYAVPVLVTAQRVLVPFLMVPFLLGFEYREEPNLFYHTIVRMFALKVYTMNVILQVLLSTPVPGGICRAIFIGKVYWRQEIVDLVFCLVLDIIMTLIRLQKPVLPEFDEEELAERVMELLYRQAFIWVSAPYSPMLAYLGLFSTSILYFWQSVTIPLSYAPPTRGWNVKQSNKEFRVQLLCTAVATFLPTTIFLHQSMDCGPHIIGNTTSPYAYIEAKVEAGPTSLQEMTYWISVPSTSLSLLCASIVLQVFLSALSTSRSFKQNVAIDKLAAERHDKLQLMRSAGLKV